jgi:iron complex outermembrane receptor protein
MSYRQKSVLLVGVSLLCGATPALAQTAAPAATPATAAKDSEQMTGVTGDIVVTARRREERLQDVPLTVQAFSGETLEQRGLTRTEDLQQTAPSLSIQASAQGRRDLPRFEIRGITSDEATLAQDTSVAIYFDDVYQARPAGVNQQLYDLENVQVLSGPQGTLFGRNSTAGAILFTSKRPTDRLEGEVSLTYGNYDRRELRGVINLPVSDSFKLRFSGQRLLRDGYTRDIGLNRRIDDTNAWTARGSALFESGGFTNLTVGDYFHSRDNLSNNILTAVRACTPAAGVPAPFNTLAGSPPLGCLYGPVGNAILGTPDIFAALAKQRALGVRTVAYDTPTFAETTAYGFSNVTTLQLSDDWTLKNIIGHRHTKTRSQLDLDGTQVHVSGTTTLQTASTLSEELQLQGDLADNRLNFVGGFFYFRETGKEYTKSDPLGQVNPAGVPAIIDADGKNTSTSVFAQVTYKFPFLEGLSATVGGRYTWDKRQLIQLPTSVVGPTGRCYYLTGPLASGGTPLNPCGRNLITKNSEPTWTLGLDYKVTDKVLLYITSRRGYRAGGFTFRSATPAEALPFLPETITDVEAGIKADWDLGGGARLRTNGDVYSLWYNDIQRTVAFRTPNNDIAANIQNAAKARISGFEATVNLSLGSGFDVGGFVGYVDAKHTEFDTLVRGVPTTLTNVPFTNSKVSWGLNGALTPLDTPEAGRITITANWAYRSKFFGPSSLPDIEPESIVPGQGLLNVGLDWANIGGSNFSGQIFVRNLLDEDYIVGVLSLQNALGLTTRTYGEPRMYGLTLKYKFGN